MASSTELVSDIKDTGQLHQPWYQHMNDKERTTTIVECLLTVTTIMLMNFAALHFRLRSRKELIELALTTTLAFHKQIDHTSYYTCPTYIIFWITWIVCKKHKKNHPIMQ